MLNYHIEFDSDIRWKNVYRRNNKGKDSKHILCFPDHNPLGHKSNEFCGRSIKVKIDCPKDSKLLVCGNFSLLNDVSNIYYVNDIISYSILNKDNKSCECPFYFGEEIDPFKLYEINSEKNSWVMNMALTKTPKQFVFLAYLLIESDKPDYYQCVASIQSPPFMIVSSRRNKIKEEINLKLPSTPILYQPQFSPVNCDSDEKDESQIKSRKDPNYFKFDSLMPHIYDNDDDKSELSAINNNIQNISISTDKVVNKTVDSIEEMKKTINDVVKSEPNTVYKLNLKKGEMEMRVINKTQISSKREELSFHGEKLDLENNSDYEYLDSFGNKRIFYPGCYWKDESEDWYTDICTDYE